MFLACVYTELTIKCDGIPKFEFTVSPCSDEQTKIAFVFLMMTFFVVAMLHSQNGLMMLPRQILDQITILGPIHLWTKRTILQDTETI